jgi:hypothetical protein
MFLDGFDILILKIIFLKNNFFDIFSNKKILLKTNIYINFVGPCEWKERFNRHRLQVGAWR